MKTNELISVATVVVALHLAALGLAFGPIRWQYLLVGIVSADVIWIVLPRPLSRRRWVGFLVGVVVALTVQQAVFRLWRSQFTSVWPPLAQFAAIHVLIGFGIHRVRRELRRGSRVGTAAARRETSEHSNYDAT